jgi:hypothetical protein
MLVNDKREMKCGIGEIRNFDARMKCQAIEDKKNQAKR